MSDQVGGVVVLLAAVLVLALVVGVVAGAAAFLLGVVGQALRGL